MKTVIISLFFLFLAGCSTTESVGGLFDKLEFKDGQEGCIRASGQVSVGGNPFASSTINVSMIKTQGEDAPDC
jgi:hypothetical protein